MKVVALRHIGPFELIGDKFSKLWQWVGKNQVPAQGCLGMWLDDPSTVPAEELRSDACIVVPESFKLGDLGGLDLRTDHVVGGEYAVVTHLGPYDGLGEAWGTFCKEALPALGRETAPGPTFEMYVNDCSTVPPAEVRTDLFVPLKPEG